MQKVGEHTSKLGVKREFYLDSDGKEVVKTLGRDITDDLDENHDERSEFRPHQKGGFRKVASVPIEVINQWLVEAGIEGYCDDESLDLIINHKLRDPENKKFLTTKENYRMKKYGA